MSGLLKFFLILSVILIAAPALASDTGKAAQAAGFANSSSAPPAPAAQSFANSSSAKGSPSLIKLPPAPHAVAPSTTPPASAKAMTLEDCVAIALGDHPRIKGAEEDVDFGRFRTLGAAAELFPSDYIRRKQELDKLVSSHPHRRPEYHHEGKLCSQHLGLQRELDPL